MNQERLGKTEELDEIIELLQSIKQEWITKVPGVGSQINKMIKEFELYRNSLEESASVLVMGRTGAGKSSLINALVNDPKFLETGDSAYSETKQIQVVEHATSNGAVLRFLDTRGVGESGHFDGDALSQIKDAARLYQPRVAFLLMPPDRSHWEVDLAFFTKALRLIQEGDGRPDGLDIEIAGMITKVDTIVDPFDPTRNYDWKSPVTKSEQKLADWCGRLENSLNDSLGDSTRRVDVFPVCTKFGYNDENEEIDLRYGFEEVMAWLGQRAPFDLLLKMSEFVRPNLRRELALDLVHRFSAMAGVVGAVPIPLADAPVLAYLQYVLIRLIYTLAQNSEAASPKQYFSFIGGATQMIGKIAARQLIATLTQIVPGWGTVVGGAANATIAAGFTEAFGRVAVAYYFDGVSVDKTLVSLREIAATLGRRK